MKIAFTITRILLGLVFLLASVGYFFELFPAPEAEGQVEIFNNGMEASIYIFPTVKAVELLCAISFLSGIFVPLFAIVLFPITLNIVLFHAFLAPEGLAIGLFILAGNLFIFYFHFSSYKLLLTRKPDIPNST